MSDEPLYCHECGAEDFDCGCMGEPHEGPRAYCEASGLLVCACGCEFCSEPLLLDSDAVSGAV